MLRLVLCIFALLLALPAWAGPKRVLLVGQGSDGHPPQTHEFRAGVRILGDLLKQFDHLEVTTVSADGAWKEGPELIGRSDCVVLFLSQGYRWIQLDEQRLKAFQDLAKRGGGIVAFHWAIGAKDDKYIAEGLKLLGGCHGGSDRKYIVTTTQLKPADPAHPVATGINAIEVKDEFYYSLKFAQPAESIKAVMKATINDKDETVAWAWQRPDGGRSFGFSGLHFHANWQRPEYRRLAVQAILWATNEPIPERGANVDIDENRLPVDVK